LPFNLSLEFYKLNKSSVLSDFETSIKVPSTVDIFIALYTGKKSKVIVSNYSHIIDVGHCYYVTVRTQAEANKLNKEVCDKQPVDKKKNEQACIELKKYEASNSSS